MRHALAGLTFTIVFVLCGCAEDSPANTSSSGATGTSDSGATGACGEPTTCPPPDATKKPQISCMTPDRVKVGEAVTLHIFGTHLQDSRGGNTKVALDGTTGIEGIPRSPCHLTLDIPGGYFTSAKDVAVNVATAVESDTATLPVR